MLVCKIASCTKPPFRDERTSIGARTGPAREAKHLTSSASGLSTPHSISHLFRATSSGLLSQPVARSHGVLMPLEYFTAS